MTMQDVIIGDAASQALDIVPSDFIVGWRTSGLPGEAVSMDSFETLLRLRLRSILTDIITQDAPTGLTLNDITILNNTTVRLEYEVAGHGAHLDVDLAAMFSTADPAVIGMSSVVGIDPSFPHGDHGHRLPSRTAGEVPVVGLDQMANAPPAGYGRRISFNPTTGEPEYADEVTGVNLSTNDPQPVGGPGAPSSGVDPTGTPIDHLHEHADRSVTLTKIAAATSVTDYGKAVGYDPTTGEPAALDPPGTTFIGDTDTPVAYGVEGQAPVVNPAGDALEFGRAVHTDPDSGGSRRGVRATDAFDMFLEIHWNAVAGAEAYEWQRKPSASSEPGPQGTAREPPRCRRGTQRPSRTPTTTSE